MNEIIRFFWVILFALNVVGMTLQISDGNAFKATLNAVLATTFAVFLIVDPDLF